MKYIPPEMPPVIRVKRTSPLYNTHSYLTKVPEQAIIPFIEHFTNPGDTVVDCFAGSGMTGVAAILTGRRAILSDISRLGQHIGNNYCRIVDSSALQRAGQAVIEQVNARYGQLYTTTCPQCRRRASVNRLIWSELFRCPICSDKVVYYEALYDRQMHKKRRSITCPNGHPFVKRGARRLAEEPAEVHFSCTCTRTIQKKTVDLEDLALIEQLESQEIPHWWPDVTFNPTTEMFGRSALAKHGRTRLRDFYSARNLTVLACLWECINAITDQNLREKLRFGFTAILSRASKRYQWGPDRPLNAQNQTYYVAPVFYEWNVVDLFERKLKVIITANDLLKPRSDIIPLFTDLNTGKGQVSYHIASAHQLNHIPTASIDYVFTDPPFGSNIFYSDMNFFAEAWLGEFTDPTYEAVVRTTPGNGNTVEDYQQLLIGALWEMYRVLKPGGWATVVFSNSQGAIWRTFQQAIKSTPFRLSSDQMSLLDKGQRSVKGLNSATEHVVTFDLILSLQKPTAEAEARTERLKPLENLQAIVEKVVASLEGQYQTTSYIYLFTIKHCLQAHIDVEQVNLSAVAECLANPGYKQQVSTHRWR